MATKKEPATPKPILPAPVEEAPVQPAYVAPPVYAPAPGYAPPPAGPPQGLSIASMVCGIAGLFLTMFGFGFLPALAAVITGHIAQRSQPLAKPFWLTGIITGYVGLAINLVIGAVVVISIIAVLIGGGMYFGQYR